MDRKAVGLFLMFLQEPYASHAILKGHEYAMCALHTWNGKALGLTWERTERQRERENEK